MTLDRVVGLVDDLNRSKRLAVGSSCPSFPRGIIGVRNTPFAIAVSAIWKWYHEELRHDRHFLTPRADGTQGTKLRAFEQILNDQRHANEHADYSRAHEAQAWRAAIRVDGEVPSEGEMLYALFEELAVALDILRSIADRVSRANAGVEAWRKHETRSPRSEIVSVLFDIGRENLPQWRVDAIVRRFEGHPKLKSARTPGARLKIAAVVAMEMSLDPLTVPYDEILDEFGLIGNQLGLSLLLVAHGIEAAGLTGPRLLPALRRAWREVDAGS